MATCWTQRQTERLQRIICFISQTPLRGSCIKMSSLTLIAVQRAKEHPVSNKRQMIKPDAIFNTVALQNRQL